MKRKEEGEGVGYEKRKEEGEGGSGAHLWNISNHDNYETLNED